MNAKAGNIRLFDKTLKKLILKASYGVSNKYKTMKYAVDVGTSVSGYVFEQGRMYVSEDLRANHMYRFPEYALKEGITALICTPLSTSEEKIGVFTIYFPTARKFDRQETSFFSVLGNFLATFFTSQSLHYELQRSYLDIAKALVIALEEKDPYTKGHSERVQEYAVQIAKELKLSKKLVQVLSDFSVLHDIGKVIIDSVILNKMGSLNNKEWSIIKKHPLVGARMVSPVDGLVLGIPLIKHHHERVDGKGYPEGLAGSHIPLLARIIAVADAFDAMISPRAYRNALTIKEAKKELLKNAGNQFDRKIINVMIDLIDEGRIKIPQ